MSVQIVSQDYLANHGILGQKWGKRNGPPYPLGAGDHSASEKKAGWKKSLGGGRNEEEYGKSSKIKKAARKVAKKVNEKARRDIEKIQHDERMKYDPLYRSRKRYEEQEESWRRKNDPIYNLKKQVEEGREWDGTISSKSNNADNYSDKQRKRDEKIYGKRAAQRINKRMAEGGEGVQSARHDEVVWKRRKEAGKQFIYRHRGKILSVSAGIIVRKILQNKAQRDFVNALMSDDWDTRIRF